METKERNGKLITFEGPEGSGKSTQSKLLCEYLQKKDIPFVYAREPGTTKLGEKLRDILLDPANVRMAQRCEILLYLAARAQIVKEVVAPALREGKVVVLDRFTDSTIAYQGYGHNLDIELIKKLSEFVVGKLPPDLTILLDIETEEGLKRSSAHHTQDRMEKRGANYHRRVRDGYLRLAELEPERIKLIPVRDDIDATQKRIREEVDKIL